MTTETTTSAANPLDAIRHASGTDIGQRREENQDSFGIIENPNFKLYIVADGMGGVKGGGVASNLAINVLKECLEDKQELTALAICSAVEHANEEIFEKGSVEAGLAGMGTTYVGLGFVDSKLFISSVGDSRAYRIRDNHISQLTTDHTLVQELLRSGAINPEQANNHPVSHMLTRSLGPAPSVEVDCWLCSDGPARGDIYVLCSDGLYNLVQDQEIASFMQDNYIDVAVQKLIKLANDRGGTDNITVIAIEVGEEFPLGPEAFEGVSGDNRPKPELRSEVPVGLMSSELETKQTQIAEEMETESADVDRSAANLASVADVSPGVAILPPDSPEVLSHVDLTSEKLIVPRPHIDSANPGLGAQTASSEVGPDSISPFTGLLLRAKPFPRVLLLGGAFTIVTLIGFIGGFYAPRLLGSGQHNGATVDVSAPQFPQAQVAKVLPEAILNSRRASSIAPSARVTLQEMPPFRESEQHGNGSEGLGNGHDQGMAPEELARVTRRKNVLQQLANELEDKIVAFDRPLNAKLSEGLKSAREQRELLEVQQDDLRSQIDVATRKLAVWYGRRKRLQTTDPINLATEVAVASQEVKDKKEVFELATWSYLKEAEVLRYNPSDSAQDKKVMELAKLRKDRQRELADEVKKAIEREVADSDRSIAELTFKRDRVLATIENIRRDEEYVKILMGNDPKAKDIKRREFMRERDLATAELDELSQLVPTENIKPTVNASESSDSTPANSAGEALEAAPVSHP